MNLEKYKFEKRNDRAVFKVLLRCYKDDGKFSRCYALKRNFRYIVEHCYRSRHSHPNENYQRNIWYWPSDIPGGGFSHSVMSFIYVVRLINALKAKPKELITRLKEAENDIIYNKGLKGFKKTSLLLSMQDEIHNAYIRCGVSEKETADKIIRIFQAATNIEK